MSKLLKSSLILCTLTAVILLSQSFYAFSKTKQGHAGFTPPPPADIEINTASVEGKSNQLEIRIKVTPQEDMHLDISCFLQGMRPLMQKGMRLRRNNPRRYMAMHESERNLNSSLNVGLWTGPLKGGISKDLTFRVIMLKAKECKIIANIKGLAKWGIKEKTLNIR